MSARQVWVGVGGGSGVSVGIGARVGGGGSGVALGTGVGATTVMTGIVGEPWARREATPSGWRPQ